MAIYRAVLRSTPKVSPKTPHSVQAGAKVDNLDVQYYAGTRTLTFYGTVRSHNQFGTYNVMLTFKNVREHDGLTEEEIMQGFKPKPTLGDNEIMGRCGCPNYRFRFDKANRMHGVGTGARFGFYRRRTNRKPYNPKNLIGFCAHLMEFVNYLQENGFVL